MPRLKTILLPTDFSRECRYALDWAIRLLRNDVRATIVLLTVPKVEPVLGSHDYAMAKDQATRKAQSTAERWRRHIPSPINSKVILSHDTVFKEIGTVCRAEKVDLIMIPTHHRTGLARLMHPSLTARLVRQAAWPLMVLHPGPVGKAKIEVGA